jgi:hypothetical protein
MLLGICSYLMLRKVSTSTVYVEKMYIVHMLVISERVEWKIWVYGSGQPHSVAIHLPMLTFFDSEVTMNGC